MTDVIEVQVPAPVQVIEVTVPGAVRTVEVQVPGLRGQPGPAADTSALIPRAGLAAAKDSAEFATLQADSSVLAIFLQNAQYDRGATLPTKPVWGPGSLTVNDTLISGFQTVYDAINSNAVYRPNIYAHGDDDDYNGLPPNNTTEAHYNLILAPGFRETQSSLFPASNAIRRCVFAGVEVGTRLLEAERVIGIGNAVLKHARYAERCDLVGSLAGQWFGIDPSEDSSGRAFMHDLLWAGGTPVSNPAWDQFGLETDRPGTRAEIAAFTAWATSKSDVLENVVFGRDALVELVKGKSNTATGYRALCAAFAVDSNTATGNRSLHNCWGGNGNTADGAKAGFKHQKGDYNFYGSFQAGYSHLEGDSNTILGVNAGRSINVSTSAESLWTGSRNVLIGQSAGRKTDGTMASVLTDLLYIQNSHAYSPLISGEFANGKVGINMPVGGTFRANLHVYGGASGGALVNTSADELVIEGSGPTGLTILTPATGVANIFVADPDAGLTGYLQYNQTNDYWQIGVAGNAKVRITSTSIGFFGKVGSPAAPPTLNAAATDAATTQALVNQIRTALINFGLSV